MYVFIAAIICTVLGVLPLLVNKKVKAAIYTGVISLWLVWGILYLSTPSTVYPLGGIPGFMVFLLWIAAAIIDAILEGKFTYVAFFPIFTALIYMGSCTLGSGMFRASDYKNMIGTMEERVWTQDVQPKDPKHMRMSTTENAVYLAKKVLGEAGAVGSQFQISEGLMTLQRINNELWYVVPLDYGGISVWTSTDGVPGYIMVHGEDPHRPAVLKMLPDKEKMQYTPGAFFWNELERHLRNSGFLNTGLVDYTFEIDENGKAWWVVTAYKPTIMWSGEKITGVVIVDPASGDPEFFPQDKIPDWVDRAVPRSFIENYLTWSGKYVHGWKNTWWGGRGITQPETPNLIYGSEGQADWVTGITSQSSKDDSLIAVVYTNSRTGQSVRYAVRGGSTDAAVLDAVNKNSHVEYKKLHGVDPQLYNVYGTMASVVPLLNESHAFQGVAIVSINNIQTVAVGNDQYEALREYEKLIMRGGQQVVLDKERVLKKIEGVVDRRNQEALNSGTTYYLHLKEVPHIFTGGAGELSVKLPLTQAGDRVVIEYYDSDRDVVPMHAFENLSLPLTQTGAQKEVRAKNVQEREKQEAKQDTDTIREGIKDLTPEQLQELKKHIPKK